ncbi:dihydropteroate synthase [Mycoavidus cysteinexigens]|uniref:dihydropteroate synthase n=1 Tax=Mycoavidus cysteinexigens TaxID=1553431 RepID=A0A2Z6EXP4_9BURK|nr:dihydropteroate synthase [Mycoavidus cysteinexigens]BBE10229.1 dihydropteroate synthase [Mycoavidus cysteinexigens]GAM53408.1 dihydropteroate synthase [bacterium endosymbiont of Mortierella elongata FMR23-6]GLR00646.1 dihydropteroate synthase [Mycoavidus cysteinexigens]
MHPPGPSEFQCGRFRLALTRPLVMGILNITPDSFYDGARFLPHEAALARAHQMVDEGADLIDIGGESTRPGAQAVPLNQELGRVLPMIKALREIGIPLSIDTHKPEVMRAALAEGVDLINDIWGFRQPGALEQIKQSSCGLCVMHMSGDPQTMQKAPSYQDVASEVAAFLQARIVALEAAGIERTRMSVDPGFGFGKTLEHNYTLLARLAQLAPADVPLLIGVSRKSMLGAVTGRPANERAAASIAAAICAAERGARIIRVHDVALTVDALKVWHAVRTADTGQ